MAHKLKKFDRNGKLSEYKNKEDFENEAKEWQKNHSPQRVIYDDAGYPIAEIDFKDGQFIRKTTYEYNDKHREKKVTVFDANGNIEKQKLYFYENNIRIKSEHYIKGVLERTYLDSTDEKGNHILTVRKANGQLEWKYIFVYLDKKMLEQKCCAGNGHLVWTTQYKYNKQNLLTESRTYDKKGLLMHKELKIYDENSRKTNVRQFIHNNYKHKWTGKFLCELCFHFQIVLSS